MNLFGRPLWDWIRACGRCGRAFGPVDFFCAGCWRELRARSDVGARLRRPYEDFPAFSLWSWDEENDPYLRPLIYALKGGWGEAIVEKLVEDLSFARASLPLRPREFVVALPPRARGQERDHAWRLASEFARLWGAPLWDGLGNGLGEGAEAERAAGSQKRKGAAERRKLRFRAIEPMPEAPAWVFIDDVFTTGATARAAYEALGRPARFEAWALAARPSGWATDIAAIGGIW